MSAIPHPGTFEEGVLAGNQLLDLISEIEPSLRLSCEQFTPDEKLKDIYAEIWQHSTSREPLRSWEGLLSKVLKPTLFDGWIVTLWGADKLLENQSLYAPICEIPRDLGLVQLGYWTGRSDGDGWCLDLNERCIRCVGVGSGSSDLEDVRSESYGMFTVPSEWVAYLREKAWKRGWIAQL